VVSAGRVFNAVEFCIFGSPVKANKKWRDYTYLLLSYYFYGIFRGRVRFVGLDFAPCGSPFLFFSWVWRSCKCEVIVARSESHSLAPKNSVRADRAHKLPSATCFDASNGTPLPGAISVLHVSEDFTKTC
jgi:hypothetical protein